MVPRVVRLYIRGLNYQQWGIVGGLGVLNKHLLAVECYYRLLGYFLASADGM